MTKWTVELEGKESYEKASEPASSQENKEGMKKAKPSNGRKAECKILASTYLDFDLYKKDAENSFEQHCMPKIEGKWVSDDRCKLELV